MRKTGRDLWEILYVFLRKAVRFWRAYLEEHPDHIHAQLERLLCLWHLRSENVETGISFQAFKAAMVQLIHRVDLDAAFLWDRVGHWAQYDGNGAKQKRPTGKPTISSLI